LIDRPIIARVNSSGTTLLRLYGQERGLTRVTCARIILIMNLTLSVDEEVLGKARRKAEALGTSVNQLVREYLEQVAGKADPKQGADEFVRLSRMSKGNSQGWKFDREEAHERR